MELIPLKVSSEGDLCEGKYYINDSLIEFDVINQDFTAFLINTGSPSDYFYVYSR